MKSYLQRAQCLVQIALRGRDTRQHDSTAVSAQRVLQETRQFRLAVGHVLDGVARQRANHFAERQQALWNFE